MSNIKNHSICSYRFLFFGSGFVCVSRPAFSFSDSLLGSFPIMMISNQETIVSDSTPKVRGGGVEGFSPSGKVLSAETTSVQTDIVQENISDSPLLSLLWKRHQNSQITVRNGSFIIASIAPSQGDVVSENISDSPLLSLPWKQYQKSKITVRNGDFIVYDKEKLRIAKESVTSKKI